MERVLDEIHDHKSELRPNTELLSALQKSEGENLAWKKNNPKIASRKLVLILLQWQQGSLCKQSQQSSLWFFV